MRTKVGLAPLADLEHLLRPVERGQRLGRSTGVGQTDPHVAEVPGQLMADVGVLGIRPEQRLAQVG